MDALCRHCGANLEISLCDLGMSPLANSYVASEARDRMEPFYPLHAYVCSECFLVQLQEFESPEHIFSDYAYFSSFSESWVAHAKAYAEKVIDRFALSSTSRVVEIASNDGYLLQFFNQRGIPVQGIEPAANVALEAEKKGIPSLVKFFGSDTAAFMTSQGMSADLLIGNNVLAHVPNLNDFVSSMKVVLKADGVITMEFPHLLALMKETQFDTIYHEHFSYFSLLAVRRVFLRHGLRIFDVERLSTHGGSLRIFACHSESRVHSTNPSVETLEREELDSGLGDMATYAAFSEQVKRTKRQLLRWLIDAREAGKSVVGYGAPAKGNTLLNYCGVGTDLLEYTVDRSPHKQGRLLPGVRIPICAPERIAETKPDYVLILPWNLKDEIVSQMAHVREWGGKFVVPIPEPVVIA